jgi:hypothetical protein
MPTIAAAFLMLACGSATYTVTAGASARPSSARSQSAWPRAAIARLSTASRPHASARTFDEVAPVVTVPVQRSTGSESSERASFKA